jgi:hypothetical protein
MRAAIDGRAGFDFICSIAAVAVAPTLNGLRGGCRADSDAMRVLRAGRIVRSRSDREKSARAFEPGLEIEGLLRTMRPGNTPRSMSARSSRNILARSSTAR